MVGIFYAENNKKGTTNDLYIGLLMIIFKRKDQETETRLLSDDEVDELAVLLGINLYSAEDHRIFITGSSRIICEMVSLIH